METTFSTRRRVKFAETDMAGIAHFTNYFRYMEEAEHAFLRARGLSVVLEDERGKLGFPKVSARCDYKRPARYDELVEIVMAITCQDGKTVNYACEISSGGQAIATGAIKVAFCRFPADKPPYPLPITDEVLEKLFS